MPALCITVNKEGKRILELLMYAFWGVDVNLSPGPAHIRREGFRCGLRLMDQPHPNSPLEIIPALKMDEQCDRTPVGEALRALTLTNGYPNVSDCAAFSKKFVSVFCLCVHGCSCRCGGGFSKPCDTKHKQYNLFLPEMQQENIQLLYTGKTGQRSLLLRNRL